MQVGKLIRELPGSLFIISDFSLIGRTLVGKQILPYFLLDFQAIHWCESDKSFNLRFAIYVYHSITNTYNM